jgi:hypothetical protein
MTGTIARVGPQKRYCFIQADGTDWYAHERDFPDPSIIRLKQKVECIPKLAKVPGKAPAVTNVIAA